MIRFVLQRPLRALICIALFASISPAQSPLHYTDIAPRSNFTYRTDNNFTGRKYFPQPMCGGIAAFDFDNDGRMDLYFTNGAKLPELEKSDPRFYNCLLRNRGDGTFEDVTARAGLAGKDLGYSFGVAAGDYDNDGFADLFVCNAGRNALYHNNGDGTFTDVTEHSGLTKPKDVLSVAAAWFDYDNDGKLDLVVSNYTVWTPQSDRVCGVNGQEYYCHPKVYGNVAHRLYHNLGNGHFADVTEASGFAKELGKGMGIAIADFNGDGYPDVFIANDTVRNFLFVNQKGSGAFKESAFEWGVAYDDTGNAGSSMGVDAKDYDNDGWPDVFYNNLKGQIWGLFHNAGGKALDYASGVTHMSRLSAGSSGWSNGFFDYNNDGWKDIYSSNGGIEATPESAQHDTIFENIDGKEFRDVSGFLGADFNHVGFQRGSVFADLNNDGFPDLVVTSLGEKPRILLNSGGNGNHWLLVNTVGRRSNRDGIGAALKLTTASGRTLYNHVTTSVGFMSSSDKRVHSGLGPEKSIATLEIRWPSGVIQLVKKPKADQILTLREP